MDVCEFVLMFICTAHYRGLDGGQAATIGAPTEQSELPQKVRGDWYPNSKWHFKAAFFGKPYRNMRLKL